MMKQRLSAMLFPLLFFLGLSVLLYPTVSDRWNRYTQSRAIVDYSTSVESMAAADFSKEFAAAEEYNAALREVRFPLMYVDRVAGYEDLLNVASSDIMGYVTIEKIGAELPIYHGTSESVLNVGVGHLEGTSLPIGGANTHAVLSAHRGLPSAKLFTDLDRLETGDRFEIHVLGQTLIYQVRDILVVLPEEVEALYVQKGQDLCTLMTCTPYGINTHRLLVCGERVEQTESAPIQQPAAHIAMAEQISAPLAGLLLTLPILLIVLVVGGLVVWLRSLRCKGGMDRVL